MREEINEIDEVRKALHRDILGEIYGPKWRKYYRNELLNAFEAVEDAINEEQTDIQIDKSIIEDFVEETKLILIEQPLDSELRMLLRRLLTLVYNWNKAYLNDSNLDRETLLAIRIIDLCLTVNELISLGIEVIRRFRSLSMFRPPTFELSRHYLQTIIDKFEVGEDSKEQSNEQ